MNKIKENLKLVINTLDNKKAEDIRVIDISGLTPISDYFVIAHANSSTQLKSLVEGIEEELEKNGVFVKQIEGNSSSGWILIDYADFIVHIFDKENRLFYNLEKMWIDGKALDINDFIGGTDESKN